MCKRFPNFLISVLLLSALAILFTYVLRAESMTKWHVTETARTFDHAHDVGSCLRDIALDVKQADTHQREFLIEPDAELKDAFDRNRRQVDRELSLLEMFTRDSAVQHDRALRLAPLVHARIADLQAGIANKSPIRIGGSKRFSVHADADLDGIIFQMRTEEYSLVKARTDSAQASVLVTEGHVVAALWLVIVLILATIGFAAYHLTKRSRIEISLTKTNDVLRVERESLSAVTTFLSDVVNARFDMTDLMKLVADRTLQLTSASGAAIEILEGDELVYKMATGDLVAGFGIRMSVKNSLAGMCLESGKILRSDDVEVDSRVNVEACRKLGVRSMVVVPLQIDRMKIGVLKVSAGYPNAFDNHAVEILELMAGVIATAMSRAAQFQANEDLLRDRTEALESLETAKHELTEQLTRVEDLNVVLQFQYGELQKANDQLEALATTDGLTGLKNHRAFQERLQEEFQRAVRYNTPLSVVLLDVDHFKQYNDAFGHPAGDEVLSKVARIMESVKRDCDLAGRYGGEEFVFVLPLTSGEAATVMAERCRVEIESAAWDMRSITASFGVASLSDGVENPASLLTLADAALYRAKSAGRNQVHQDGAPITTKLKLAA